MRLSLDLGYILKRVIIGVLIALIVMFVKNNVFALTCASGTTYANQYYDNGSWTSMNTNPFISIPTTATLIRSYFYNSGINNNHITFSGFIGLTAFGDYNTDPVVSFYYGSSTTITSSCTSYISRSYAGNDDIHTQTTWNINFQCDYTGSSTSNNNVRVQINISSFPINRFSTSSRCIQIGPSDTDIIINNDNSNALEIAQDMYNYYSSLWDKSNVQEDVILSAIDNLNDNISDMMSDIADSVQDAADSINDNLNNANITLDGTDVADAFNGYGDSTHDYFLFTFLDQVHAFLNRINGSTCSPLTFDLFGGHISLPCGTTLFWDRDFRYVHGNEYRSTTVIHGTSTTDLNTMRDNFKSFWNILFGGSILYLLLWKFYLVLHDVMDPLGDNLEDLNSAISVKDEPYRMKHAVGSHYDVSNLSRAEKNKNIGLKV